MKDKVLIIGKRSNLSKNLRSSIKNSELISSEDISNLNLEINKYEKVNIIYNTCFNTHLLNKKGTDPIEYSNYSFHYLAQFINICQLYSSQINSIIYTSSCGVYGENKCAKETDHIKIKNLYASLKISSEYLLKKYLDCTNINLTFARLFNLYGGDDKFSVISKINHAIKNNKSFLMFDNGQNIRDYIHIYDVVEIYKLILNLKYKGLINISTGIGTSTKSIIEIAENHYKKKLKIVNDKSNDIKVSIGSNNLLRKKLNYNNFIDVKDQIFKDFL